MEASILTAVFLPVALAVIMLGVGLSLTVAHFRQILVAPRPVFTGVALQILALPLLAWLIAWLLALPPELAVGLVLIAACPGGATSNLIAHLAKGDTALSITLTALSSFIIIVSLPVLMNLTTALFLDEGQYVALSVPKTILQILLITVIPVAIGMALRARWPLLANRTESVVKVLSVLFLALIIAGILLRERANLADFFIVAGAAALLLNLASMAVGYVAARSMRISAAQTRTIVIEVGIQNGTMGVAVATAPTLLNNSTMAIPAVVYSLLMFATGAALIIHGNLQPDRRPLGAHEG